MIPFLIVAGSILGFGSAIGACYWMAVLTRVRRVAQPRYTAASGLDLPVPAEGYPSLSIVVPVHNEERVIDACAASLRAQQCGALEIIFVLDRCVDDTASILLRHAEDDDRIRLIHLDSCPDDWAGKCHAANAGARAATGDWLLFTDADTRFHPELCAATIRIALDRGLGLLSVLSTLTSDRLFERVVQPVASMLLIKMFPIERVNRDQAPRAFANGQFLLFDRSWYERLGGHDAVRSELLEDLAFARRLQQEGGRGGVVFARDMLYCSMYGTFSAFRRGWRRIFQEACRRRPSRLRKHGRRVLLSSLGLSAIQIATLVVAAMLWSHSVSWLAITLASCVGVGFLVQIITLRWIYALAGAPGVAMWLYPAGCWIVSRILFNGARDLDTGQPVEWGGRQYVLKPRY